MRFSFFKIPIVLIIATIFIAKPMYADKITIHKVCDGSGSRAWQGGAFTARCPGTGNSCKAIITKDNEGCTIVQQSNGGWIVSTQITEIKYEYNNQIFTSSETGSFTFMTQEYEIIITESTSFPQLNGVTIALDGLTTQPDGTISVYVPPII